MIGIIAMDIIKCYLLNISQGYDISKNIRIYMNKGYVRGIKKYQKYLRTFKM